MSFLGKASASSNRVTAVARSDRRDAVFFTTERGGWRPGGISPARARNRRPRSCRGSALLLAPLRSAPSPLSALDRVLRRQYRYPIVGRPCPPLASRTGRRGRQDRANAGARPRRHRSWLLSRLATPS